MIIRAVPIKRSNPAVENSLTEVLLESTTSERLTKNAAIMANIHKTTKTPMAAIMKGSTPDNPILPVTGVMPCRDERVEMLPSQLGKSFCKKPVMFGNIIAIPIAVAITTLTMPTETPIAELLKIPLSR